MELKKIKKAIEENKKEAIKQDKAKTQGAKSFARRGDWTLCEKEGAENGGDWVRATLTNRQEKQAKTKTDYKKALQEAITKEHEKTAQKALERVAKAEAVEHLPNNLKICINWTKSRTWGNNPRAELWAGVCGYYRGRSVGGCGYDKRSTAAAEVLQECEALQALALYMLEAQSMATIKKAMKGADMRGVFGYGLRFCCDGSVYFGAGCGMSSILQELEALGYSVTFRHEPNEGADIYQLELKKNSRGRKYNSEKVRKIMGGASC